MVRSLGALAVALVVVSGCPGDDGPSDDGSESEPFFPDDYDASYLEVRNCRGSGDHDLNNIRILADPAARTPYEGRVVPFPVDAVVLKEEYDFGDTTCEGPIKQWTVMQKLAAESSPDTLDWSWQRVDGDRMVVEEDPPRCIGCHTGCGVAPDGYDGTCAVP
jgi:hypothetical protein